MHLNPTLWTDLTLLEMWLIMVILGLCFISMWFKD